MYANDGNHEERAHDVVPEASKRHSAMRMAHLDELAEEIETLEEQIAVLEEGLPQAPGMERAALAKEIAEYRATLDSKRRALRHLEETGATRANNASDAIA